LGVCNNIDNETLSPLEWYSALDIRKEITLSDFTYDGDNSIEKLVYATEIKKFTA